MRCIRLARALVAFTVLAAALSACVPLPPAAPPPATRMAAMPGEIALLFDQTPSGELFIGDLEWVLSPQ